MAGGDVEKLVGGSRGQKLAVRRRKIALVVALAGGDDEQIALVQVEFIVSDHDYALPFLDIDQFWAGMIMEWKVLRSMKCPGA